MSCIYNSSSSLINNNNKKAKSAFDVSNHNLRPLNAGVILKSDSVGVRSNLYYVPVLYNLRDWLTCSHSSLKNSNKSILATTSRSTVTSSSNNTCDQKSYYNLPIDRKQRQRWMNSVALTPRDHKIDVFYLEWM